MMMFPMKTVTNHLDDTVGMIDSPLDLNACLNAHGLYNPFQFVLRLSPEVHRKIAAMPKGIVTGGIDFDSMQAYSTYLHETIHWWQHIGSTTGLILSLSFPAQAHANYTHLKEFLMRIGSKKSILRFVEQAQGPGGDPETPSGLASVIVNNHFDIEFFRLLATNPPLPKNQSLIRQIVEHPFFDCIGHSYQIAYGNIILILATTLDPNLRVFPDPRGWAQEFAMLRTRKEKGYYWGSEVSITPIGAYQIFEGQARFAQLQYLYFASGGKLGWDDIRYRGMLNGIYGEAFQTFLDLAELDWPPSIDHPVVALFLLVCDVAMNPGAGFPTPLRFFKTFIKDVDPGFRFLYLCRVIAQRRPDLARAIQQYSRAEYVEVSEAITGPLLIDSPLAIAETVTGWVTRSKALGSLMAEHLSLDYVAVNLPVHFVFSHFLAFNKDKYSKPEFFCWPGAWMTGERASPEIGKLFDHHSAPFVDKAEDGGIYPRLITGKSEAVIQATFDNFYAANVSYDMTRQWIAKTGPFEYDYRWLSPSGTQADMKNFADRHFQQIYGVHPNTFEIL
jgi:hypothetical protein